MLEYYLELFFHEDGSTYMYMRAKQPHKKKRVFPQARAYRTSNLWDSLSPLSLVRLVRFVPPHHRIRSSAALCAINLPLDISIFNFYSHHAGGGALYLDGNDFAPQGRSHHSFQSLNLRLDSSRCMYSSKIRNFVFYTIIRQ